MNGICKTSAREDTTSGRMPSAQGEMAEQRELIAPAGDGEEYGELVEIQEEQEVVKIPIAPAPTKPSDAEVEEHRITHVPYRCWCDECARGRGLGEQRGRHKGRRHEIPRIGVDYWYITSGGMKQRKELDFAEGEEGERQLQDARAAGTIMKCLIVRCYEFSAVFAHAVPCKGTGEDKYAAELICEDVAWLGHVRLILKSDNERSLLSLVKQALETIKCRVEDVITATSEQAQEYESPSNGGTEVGIRAVRGLFRTLKLCTERRIGQVIPPTHPLSSWLVEHAALLINAMSVGADGKTAWARARGRDFGQRLVGFGERVLYKQPPKGPQHDPAGNMGPRSHPGIFVGYHRGSNSYKVIAEDGSLVRTRGILRRPMADRWRAEALKAICATPWELRPKQDAQRVDCGERVNLHNAPAGGLPGVPRRLKITLKTIEEHGMTDGCQQCQHIQAYSQSKPGLAHTEACRARILESMQHTVEGAARVERAELRIARGVLPEIRSDGPTDEPERNVAGAAEEASEHSRPSGGVVDVRDPAYAHPGVPDPSVWRSQNGDDADASSADAMDTDEIAQISTEVTARELQTKLKNVPKVKKNVCAKEDSLDTLMISLLGGDQRRYKREHWTAARRLLYEVYSPPRVTKMLSHMSNHGLMPGLAMDITVLDDEGEPWDFNLEKKKTKALAKIREEKPLFLIGSPVCTAWCSWQALNATRRDPEVVKQDLRMARAHLDFVVQLYREQIDGGRFFLHEHPDGASSWKEDVIQDILKVPGVCHTTADQCQYGQEVQHGEFRGQPIRKRTGFMSNAPCLLKRLSKKCESQDGQCTRRQGGRHAVTSGRIAREAAKYSDRLCRAIIRGMVEEMAERGIWREGEVGLHAVEDKDGAAEARALDSRYSGRYRDDVTGQPLRDDLVREARLTELKYFNSKGVWEKRPRAEARQRTGKGAISVRWVDVNKGDDLNPRYRSRLVARQLKAHDRSGASFFAPTPPLEALRTVLSLAATTVGTWRPCHDPVSERRTQISLLDISRAYFNAKVDPGSATYVQLPEEDKDAETKCARLLRHMYGTRAAADGWQEEYSVFLVETLKFRQGAATPCIFRHPTKEIVVTVHGDDFTAVGPKSDLDWYEEAMRGNYELTSQPRLGPGADDAKEAIILNRVIRWGSEGIEYEADPRQPEKLVSECGMDGVNPVATPGVRMSSDQIENDKDLPAHLHTAFRGSAARANYLAADRLDCQFSAKEVCRWMAKPTEGSWAALKRMCRYLVGLPRLVYHFKLQEVKSVDVYTDTDWAGCPRTRKSTSGGCVILGAHTVKTWSSTQSSVALSSGEAEFNGVVKGAGIGLGYQSLLRDLGIDIPLRVWTDSSAAIGICSRQGLGKLRHLDTHTLWVQQAVRSKRVDLRKIDGERNPADVFTKHSLTRERLRMLTKLFDCEYRDGRAASAPQTRTGQGVKRTMSEAMVIREGIQEGCVPVMPHRVHTEEELDELYPPLKVADDVADEDMKVCGEDDLLRHGEGIARSIISDAACHGRKRMVN